MPAKFTQSAAMALDQNRKRSRLAVAATAGQPATVRHRVVFMAVQMELLVALGPAEVHKAWRAIIRRLNAHDQAVGPLAALPGVLADFAGPEAVDGVYVSLIMTHDHPLSALD